MWVYEEKKLKGRWTKEEKKMLPDRNDLDKKNMEENKGFNGSWTKERKKENSEKEINIKELWKKRR